MSGPIPCEIVTFHSAPVEIKINKNAFQWDAYRPLVDRIPPCTAWRGVYPSMHWAGGCLPGECLPRGGVCLGVSAQGVTTQGGVCLWSGGVCRGGSAWGVSASGPWGVYPNMQWGRHPPVDRQTPVKT